MQKVKNMNNDHDLIIAFFILIFFVLGIFIGAITL